MNIIDIELIKTNQNLYDSFNNFILSDDTKVLHKLITRYTLLEKVKNVPGDIVECGVFKGTGLMTFLKLKRLLMPNTYKKVIGFDFFNTKNLLATLQNQDKESMSTLFCGRNFTHDSNFKDYLNELILSCKFAQEEFELVAGDISQTSRAYINEKPGFRISMLYIDLDLAEPTYNVLQNFWDKVALGGLVVFDEYAYHHWSESEGVDKFFKNKKVKYNSLNCICPTMYVEKENI